jgi:tetratricopeptide (TPR) repeat protein
MRCSIEVLCAVVNGVSLHLILGLAVAAGQTGVSKTSDVHVRIEQAQAVLKAGDAETAAKEFRAILALDPRNAEAHFNLGLIALSSGEYRVASDELHKALALQPSLKAQALLGICERRLGNSSAQHLLESSFAQLRDTKMRTRVGKELIGLYYQQGDPERAVPVVQKLVELDPDDVDILYIAQRLYQELAEDTLNKLAVLAPGSARMQQVIAERLINAGDLAGAAEHYRKALEIDPRIPGVHYELAQAIFESAPSNPAVQVEAEKELVTAVATDGDSARVQCEFGKIALLKSDVEGAHKHYTEAFKLDPENAEAQLGLGRVLMTMEKPHEARKYVEMAVHGDPLNAAAHYRLAQIYKRLLMASEAEKEMHMFQEVKKTKEQVRGLYRQMNRRPNATADETTESDE